MGKLAKNRVVDPHATQLVTGFRAPQFTGVNKIWPIVPVTAEAGAFMQFGADAMVIRTLDTYKRSLGDSRKRIDLRVSSGRFDTNEVSIEVPIVDRELKNVVEARRQDYIDKKTLIGATAIQLMMEKGVVDYVQNPANYAGGMTEALAGANRWADPASSPYKDCRRWLRTLSYKMGIKPQELSLAFGPRPLEAIQDHAQTQDRIKYTGKEATESMLASAIGCKEVVTLSAFHATTFDPNDPDATVFADLWGDVVIAFYEITDPSPADPLWGCIPRLEGSPIVTEYREEQTSADIKAIDDNFGTLVVSQKRGFLATTVTGLS